MAPQRDALKPLVVEEADAWFEYLDATRRQRGARYAAVEPWAWNRLQARLAAIAARRRGLRAVA